MLYRKAQQRNLSRVHWESESAGKMSAALQTLMQRGVSSPERDVSNRGSQTFAGRMAQCCLMCARAVTQRENSQGLETQLSGRGPAQNVYDSGLDPTRKTNSKTRKCHIWSLSYEVPELKRLRQED